MSKLGKRMLGAVAEAQAWVDGKNAGAVLHRVPDVKELRGQLGLTQAAFSKDFKIPLGNIRDWEQGRTTPDAAARLLLAVIEAEPDIVRRVAEKQAA